MTRSSAKAIRGIKQILAQSSDCVTLLRQAKTLEHWQQCWYAHAGDNYAKLAQVMQFKAGILTVATENAAIASRLQFAKRSLLANLKKTVLFRDLRQLQIKVLWRPPSEVNWLLAQQLPQVSKKSAISADTAAHLTQLAMRIQHPRLQQALLQLVSHAAQSSA